MFPTYSVRALRDHMLLITCSDYWTCLLTYLQYVAITTFMCFFIFKITSVQYSDCRKPDVEVKTLRLVIKYINVKELVSLKHGVRTINQT